MGYLPHYGDITYMRPLSSTFHSRLWVSQFFMFYIKLIVQYKSLSDFLIGLLALLKPKETAVVCNFYLQSLTG